MADPIYQVEKICPVCEQKIKVTKMRGQAVSVRTDTDFYTQFEDLNPYYYAIFVCSNCGYAAHEDKFFTLLESGKHKLKQFLDGKEVKLDLSGPRNWDQAVTSHKLAIYYANLIHQPASHIASLELRLAWLYREKERVEEEQAMLTRALEDYKNAYMKEQTPIGNLTEVALTYLIGELLRRTGQYDEALSYLSRVVGNPAAKNEKRILEMAREAWQTVRDLKKEGEAQEKPTE